MLFVLGKQTSGLELNQLAVTESHRSNKANFQHPCPTIFS